MKLGVEFKMDWKEYISITSEDAKDIIVRINDKDEESIKDIIICEILNRYNDGRLRCCGSCPIGCSDRKRFECFNFNDQHIREFIEMCKDI